MARAEDFMAQESPIKYIFKAFKTTKKDSGDLSLKEDYQTREEGNYNSPQRDKGVHSTPRGDKLRMYGA